MTVSFLHVEARSPFVVLGVDIGLLSSDVCMELVFGILVFSDCEELTDASAILKFKAEDCFHCDKENMIKIARKVQ